LARLFTRVKTSAQVVSRQKETKPVKDPCWFMTLKDKSITYEEIKKRQDKEMYGYPTETPLSEAIITFNEENNALDYSRRTRH